MSGSEIREELSVNQDNKALSLADATTQMLAAVVTLRIKSPYLKITPAPIKPIPVTIPAASLEGSELPVKP